ncbi:MAG: outer membrane protein assembly factor BamD [Rhabdochlamydiaceae bacterium]|nr:outer membrane protein assembly factor BamD [Rhabdochlamydiaceae bacterium]
MRKEFFYISVFIAAAVLHTGVEAAYTVRNGKLVNAKEVATLSVQEHYSAALDAYQKKEWDTVITQSIIVLRNFPTTPFAQDILFYLGVGYFHKKEFDQSNKMLTRYLKKQSTPKHFEEAIHTKFQIAEQFHHGAKKHVLGWDSLPKWIPARDEAIAIYDEVITALPHHELAARALYGKAQLLLKTEEYKSSIETYQMLIRRFPKHPLSVDSYIGIGQVYLIQSQDQYPDQDYLDLAEINLRKFRQDFPGEDKVAIAEGMLLNMKEVYASHLYDIARFYERTHKPHASHIYYTRIIAKYPETKVAGLAGKRLQKLKITPEPARPSELPVEKESLSPPAPEAPSSLMNLPAPREIVQLEMNDLSPEVAQ